jgi:hypothetical protein
MKNPGEGGKGTVASDVVEAKPTPALSAAPGQQYRLTRDTLYCFPGNKPRTCTLKAGEICTYTRAEIYRFEPRDSIEGMRITPNYPASVVESWGFWFEPVPDE